MESYVSVNYGENMPDVKHTDLTGLLCTNPELKGSLLRWDSDVKTQWNEEEGARYISAIIRQEIYYHLTYSTIRLYVMRLERERYKPTLNWI